MNRTVSLSRATQDCKEGPRFFSKGDVLAIDWDAYDAAIGWNLTTGSSFNVFETGFEKVQRADLTATELERLDQHNFTVRG